MQWETHTYQTEPTPHAVGKNSYLAKHPTSHEVEKKVLIFKANYPTSHVVGETYTHKTQSPTPHAVAKFSFT